MQEAGPRHNDTPDIHSVSPAIFDSEEDGAGGDKRSMFDNFSSRRKSLLSIPEIPSPAVNPDHKPLTSSGFNLKLSSKCKTFRFSELVVIQPDT